MAYGDIIGYLASALVFATFYVRTMMPLRMLAIASNIAFIAYSASEGLTPVLVLHSVLLPVNLARLYEIKKLLAFTRSAPARDESIEAMLPFMRQTMIQKGEFLFRKGEHAGHMYYLMEGTLQLIELDKIVTKGAIIGEIGMFSPSRERTATAVAATDCRIRHTTKTRSWASISFHSLPAASWKSSPARRVRWHQCLARIDAVPFRAPHAPGLLSATSGIIIQLKQGEGTCNGWNANACSLL